MKHEIESENFLKLSNQLLTLFNKFLPRLNITSEITANIFLNLPGKKNFSVPVDESEVREYSFMMNFNEICTSLKKFKIAIQFLENSSRKPKWIELNEYIRYHTEFFLHNLYAIKDRLKKLYQRTYKGSFHHNKKIEIKLKDCVENFFDKIPELKIRHRIVHEYYSYDEDNLSMLSVYEFLLTQKLKNLDSLKYIAKPELRKIKKKLKVSVGLYKKIYDIVENFAVTFLLENNIFFDLNGNFII